jgi:glutamate--cysteine ligase
MNSTWGVPGYEQLELSTQIVIAEALKRGLTVDVLDKSDQLIRISNGTHTEYIQEATKTSADSYITSLLLGNKWVTKTLLEEKNIAVPTGKLYTDLQTALDDQPKYTEGRWVIKPKTTNFGVGITLLPQTASTQAYEAAIKEAFQHDQTVIVEQFIPGIECRFLVIGDECVAILNRIPANVIGDGEKTIAELVEERNQDPRRGQGYKTPLERIQLGKVEQQELVNQGLTMDTIPDDGVQIFLRKNSNISTGGDSIDMTDTVHPSYLEVAIQASQAVNAKICGVDMILRDPTAPASSSNHGIIELNYNPVLYFHDYPFKGENRQTGKYVLDLLGF